MDLTLFQQKKIFPGFVRDKLATVPLDYKERNLQIEKSKQEGSGHLKAGVVLLLNYKMIQGKSEYVFQLIKRSAKVSQGGDISCPGGMLQPRNDNIFSYLLKAGILFRMRDKTQRRVQSEDKETNSLLRLFLTTALREAWEEVGLNPLNVVFLGALPSYSLTLFSRTIFPVVCLSSKPFTFRLSSEVEKVLEIPLSFFFNSENYAVLDIKTSLGEGTEPLQYQTPCLVIPDGRGNDDILWGATFNIIHNFLRIISDGSLPSSSSSRTLNKVLTIKYISPKG
ncbi:MAG: CoA pyrophosphatase [Deltaproteobacteria bacterium]|nr:CoA pyrophosphatase [Deltaproteobacteria bacterium]